jgi:hypothetical protein
LHRGSLSFGAAVRLGLLPHTASRRQRRRLTTASTACSCLRLAVATISPREGLSPPIQCPCQAHPVGLRPPFVTPAAAFSPRLSRRYRGRDARCRAPPAQIHASGFPARGSYLGCLTANRTCGMPYAIQRLGHASPVLCPVRALLARVPLGPRPWLHRLRRRSPGFVRRLHSYCAGV